MVGQASTKLRGEQDGSQDLLPTELDDVPPVFYLGRVVRDAWHPPCGYRILRQSNWIYVLDEQHRGDHLSVLCWNDCRPILRLAESDGTAAPSRRFGAVRVRGHQLDGAVGARSIALQSRLHADACSGERGIVPSDAKP